MAEYPSNPTPGSKTLPKISQENNQGQGSCVKGGGLFGPKPNAGWPPSNGRPGPGAK